jgi:hypothetical protein
MTQDDYDALKEFLRGFGGGSIVFIVFCLLCALTIWISGSNTETDKSQSAEVVGTYKDCDIIRWQYGALAEYKYFLHCPK